MNLDNSLPFCLQSIDFKKRYHNVCLFLLFLVCYPCLVSKFEVLLFIVSMEYSSLSLENGSQFNFKLRYYSKIKRSI